MRKFFTNHQFEVFIVTISLVLYLIFKDFPYFGLALGNEAFLVLLWIEIMLLFKLSGKNTIKVSLWFLIITLIFSVFNLSPALTMSIVAFNLFILGSLQVVWEIFIQTKKNKNV